MQILSEDPLTIDLTVFLPESPGGPSRKYLPGDALPEHAREQILATAAGARAEQVPASSPAADAGGVVALGIDVVESSVGEIKAYLEANPEHAETVMEAEEISTDGDPRKGVSKAVEAALEVLEDADDSGEEE